MNSKKKYFGNKVEIAGRTVKIKYINLNDQDYDGACSVDDELIVLHDELKGQKLTYVYLHECFHFLFSRLSLDQSEASPFEEIIVDGFAKFISENFDVKKK